MNIARKTRNLIGALVAAATLTLAPMAQAVDFRGGGAITDFTGCSAQGWSGAAFVRARFRLADGASNGLNNLSLFMPDGTINLAIDDPLADTRTWRRSYGNATFYEWGNWDPRPRVRFRQVTPIGGATVAEATDLLLRIRVRGFNWMPACEVMIVLALHRE
ncbi:MAG: hypothetical protein KDK12_03835 [Rhodobacteraceae bacterium]|nr:hypothetical protein [Paracoccaceae bacterium]